MNITLIIIALILFVIIYTTKRRYGLLALAVVAGSIISASWSTYVTAVLQLQGVKLLSPPLNAVVATLLIVLPATLLLFVGPKYKKKWQRAVGSLLFAVFGTLLIVIALAREVPDLMADNQIGTIAIQNYPIIIVVGVVLAIGDTILAHWSKSGKKSAD
jgi:hypothetical protein